MPQPFDSDSQVVLKQARRLAESAHEPVILPMHVLHALITDAPTVWSRLTDVDMHSLAGAVPAFQVRPVETSMAASAALANSVKRVLAYAMLEWFRARAGQIPPESLQEHLFRSELVGPEFLLLGLMRESESDAAEVLTSQGFKLEDMRERFSSVNEP
jgi:ATP-dependent Clp protease ATP-binding subunit ClpA